MIISCPQCKTKYNVDTAVIPLSGKKMRCAKCGEIWRVYPKDWEDFEHHLKIEQEIQNEQIENKEPKKRKKASFIISLLKITLVLVFLLTLVYAYAFRYQIVQRFPETEIVYEKIGINTKVLGEGLVFEDIVWNEYEDNDVRKMDFSGIISNKTDKLIQIPLLHIELLDNKGNVLQNIERGLSTEHIMGGGKIPFKITILRPAPFTKYIFVTFTKSN